MVRQFDVHFKADHHFIRCHDSILLRTAAVERRLHLIGAGRVKELLFAKRGRNQLRADGRPALSVPQGTTIPGRPAMLTETV